MSSIYSTGQKNGGSVIEKSKSASTKPPRRRLTQHTDYAFPPPDIDDFGDEHFSVSNMTNMEKVREKKTRVVTALTEDLMLTYENLAKQAIFCYYNDDDECGQQESDFDTKRLRSMIVSHEVGIPFTLLDYMIQREEGANAYRAPRMAEQRDSVESHHFHIPPYPGQNNRMHSSDRMRDDLSISSDSLSQQKTEFSTTNHTAAAENLLAPSQPVSHPAECTELTQPEIPLANASSHGLLPLPPNRSHRTLFGQDMQRSERKSSFCGSKHSMLATPRILTQPSTLVRKTHSDGLEYEVDNENGELVLYAGMIICRYEIIRVLGSGTFGQVALCREVSCGQVMSRRSSDTAVLRRFSQQQLSRSNICTAVQTSLVQSGSYFTQHPASPQLPSTQRPQFSVASTPKKQQRGQQQALTQQQHMQTNRNNNSSKLFAIKIIRSFQAHERQAAVEVNLLRELRGVNDWRRQGIVTCYGHGYSFGHYCMVFEQLGISLFELLELNQYRGLGINAVREVASQLLGALSLCHEKGITHGDVKPENVLLQCSWNHEDQDAGAASEENEKTCKAPTVPKTLGVKLIDFGTGCRTGQCPFTYLQSRYYRAPEVILDAPMGCGIDVWSAGCLLAELFLGLPLLPGLNDYHQILRIVEMFGDIPAPLLRRSRNAPRFYYCPTNFEAEIRATVDAFSDAHYKWSNDESEILSGASCSTSRDACSSTAQTTSTKHSSTLDSAFSAFRIPQAMRSSISNCDNTNSDISSERKLPQLPDSVSYPVVPCVKAVGDDTRVPSWEMFLGDNLTIMAYGGMNIHSTSPPFPFIPHFAQQLRPDSVRPKFELKSEETFCEETGTQKQTWKPYFNYSSLIDLLNNYPLTPDERLWADKVTRIEFPEEEGRPVFSERAVKLILHQRALLHDLISQMLAIDPLHRPSAIQALKHEFFTYTRPSPEEFCRNQCK